MTPESLKKKLIPYAIEAYLSVPLQKFNRQLFEAKIALLPWRDEIVFYHRLNDPYSCLLLSAIMQIDKKHQLKVKVELIFDLPEVFNPEQKKQAKYALKDASQLAKHLNIDIPEFKKTPSRRNTFQATACLLKQQPTGYNKAKKLHFLQLVSELTDVLWGHSTTTFESCLNRYGSVSESKAKTALDRSQARLVANGHYMSAMIYYGGEWYWGVDRFNYLLERLNRTELKPIALSKYTDNYLSLTLKLPTQKCSVDFYFSFRSPYSYLAAEDLFKMASQHQFDINIKPVLPMVMRGFKIPKIKRLYIVKDAKREALKTGVPFGRICDPISDSIELCMALFPYAKSESKERAFISSIARGIFAEGADLKDDEVLEQLLNRAGLSLSAAQPWISKTTWRQQVEKNQADLEALGLWGVPSMVCDKTVVWGQDRLWLIEAAVKKVAAKEKI
jgi:2-hydroxychromene-2-carboxylate isomerase